MIIFLIVVLIINVSNQERGLSDKELQELFEDNLGQEITSEPSTVSPVAQYYTSDSQNFTEITKSDFFVDKTLLIKELLDGGVSAFLEVSAAPHFGKSTNLDMIKLFLEINVDEKGHKICSKKSVNYEIFSKNNLKITKQKNVFDQHFGKFPVIFISYKPLIMVTKFDFLLKKYRRVLLETFMRHEYFLHLDKFWSSENLCRDDFNKYITEKSNMNLNQTEIEEGFVFLADMLYRYYKTSVTVLIDDYDIIVDAPVSEDCRDIVYNFTVDMNNRIIEYKHVSRVILTGSLLRGGIPYSTKVKSASECYPQILKYYGLSSSELKSLLRRFLKNSTQIEDAIACILKNYSGYVRSFDVYDEMKTNPMNEIVCSVWSVVQYLTCVRKINVGNIGESGEMSLTYLCIKDRARLIKTF